MSGSEVTIKNGVVSISQFTSSDPQVAAALQAAEADGRDLVDYVESALIIGVKALLATGVSIGVEALTDEINRSKSDIKTATEGMIEAVNKQIKEVSGSDGVIAKNIVSILGDLEKSIIAMTGEENSPIREGIKAQVSEIATKLTESLSTIASQQSTRIAKMLDPKDPESPLRLLNEAIENLSSDFQEVKKEMSIKSAVTDALENTAKSGLPYEDLAIASLQKVAGLAGDMCRQTGQIQGFIKGRFSGDGVVEIKQGERLIGRVVAEAKNAKLPLTASGKNDSWMKQAKECKENREAIAFLGLCKYVEDMPNNHRVLMVDRLTWILAYDPETDNPELLFLVYQMLKTNTQVAAGELKSDTVAEINLLVDDAISQVMSITSLSSKTASIKKLSAEVDSEIRQIQEKLLERMESVRNLMQPDIQRSELSSRKSLEIEGSEEEA
jgi:hypothetical protein